ncbi:hydroxyacid dehydrogenase, partial [Streptomyces prunicolor]|nr:hydroxyacid dehydrogenase [Streptomyces prunicolor]
MVHVVGPVDEHLDGAAFERGIQVGSAARAVAIPVAECTSAMILPATKGVPTAAREDQQWRRAAPRRSGPGPPAP